MLLDVETTARELGGLGLSTVRRLIREGQLRSVRVGRRVLIAREALEEFVQGAGGKPSEKAIRKRNG